MATRPYPSFLIYLDKAGLYRWRYQAAGNYKTLADSGESFTTHRACVANIAMIKASGTSETWEETNVTAKAKTTG